MNQKRLPINLLTTALGCVCSIGALICILALLNTLLSGQKGESRLEIILYYLRLAPIAIIGLALAFFTKNRKARVLWLNLVYPLSWIVILILTETPALKRQREDSNSTPPFSFNKPEPRWTNIVASGDNWYFTAIDQPDQQITLTKRQKLGLRRIILTFESDRFFAAKDRNPNIGFFLLGTNKFSWKGASLYDDALVNEREECFVIDADLNRAFQMLMDIRRTKGAQMTMVEDYLKILSCLERNSTGQP